MKVNVCFALILAIVGLASCNSQKLIELKSENDSLRQEVAVRNNLLYKLASNPVHYAVYNDSCFLPGSNQHDYLNEIRKHLASSKDSTLAFHLMVLALQDEGNIKDSELHSMSNTLNRTHKNYQGNLSTLTVELKHREEELVKLYQQIEDMKRMQVAEIYYLQARSLEEKAALMKFARKKKRENLREALELYQRSFALGKKEALTNINGLRKVLG